MELKTFDTILTEICDYFDSLILPKSIQRSNTNIIYLIFKALAKGWEIINNVCVILNNKFNPVLCSEEDLVSLGKIVGTKQRAGSVSGLQILAYNKDILPAVLLAGDYTYSFSSDIIFNFHVDVDTEIPAESSVSFVALSEEIGSYPVTAQTEIKITSEEAIPASVVFSCTENSSLLGHEEETILEFRKRINTDVNRQDTVNELKEKLLALPYVFDCSLVFNQSELPATVNDYTIPPYYLLIVISTAKYTDEIAEIVAENTIYPTVRTNDSHEVRYTSDVFASGYYPVYLNDFTKKDFSVVLTANVDSSYASSAVLSSKITLALMSKFNTNVHRDLITTEDIFLAIESLELAGFTLLSVAFEVDNTLVNYINFSRTELPNITSVGGI